MGEIFNGYELIEPFGNHNAGSSRWTFAKRDGEVYFLKEFIEPVFPDEDSLSSGLRSVRIAECLDYEKKKKKLCEAINRVSDGNMLRIIEFFRCDSHYYIATQKVKSESLTMKEISQLPLSDRILLCLTAAHSVSQLHKANIIHADIKASNLLLQRTADRKLSTKLIDMDSSFFEDDPPEPDDLAVDSVYFAPEACQYYFGDPVSLSCKMDVFSLGLLFHEYLTGELPEFDTAEYDYAYEAVLDGSHLTVSPTLPLNLRRLLQAMLTPDPEQRVSSIDVFLCLRALFKDENGIPGGGRQIPTADPVYKPDSNNPTPTHSTKNFYTAGDL